MEKAKAKYIGSLKNGLDPSLGLDWSNDCIETLGVKLQVNKWDLFNLNLKKKWFKY